MYADVKSGNALQKGVVNNLLVEVSEVRALPVRHCRRAAWQTLVATINGIIFSVFYSLSLVCLLFSQKGLT